MRAVLFCNEMLGLGHLGLSLAVAEELVVEEGDTALIVTGSPAFGGLRLPTGVDVMKLPTAPVGADSAWSKTGLKPTVGLALAADRVAALRADLCRSAVEHVRPDVVVVDYRPLGRNRDLVPTLELLRGRGGCVTALGIWDSDDAPDALRAHWTPELIREVGDFYDLAFVYGPPTDDDVRVESLREAGVPVHVTDFVSTPPATAGAADVPPGYLLATTGGGADGLPLLEALVRGIKSRPLAIPAVLVTGPMMADADVERLRSLSAGSDVRIFKSRPDLPELLAGARAVVSMAGYCTASEVLASGKPSLMVPRSVPREEQLNRARRLAADGRVELLLSEDLTPEALRTALDHLLAQEPRGAKPLAGASQVRKILLAATAAGT